MLVSVLPVPFADAGRQRQYEALHAALATEPTAATVLLGNLGAFTSLEADALLVRPDGLTLLVLVPRPGHLTIAELAYGPWQLDGQPLPGRAGTDNPFAQYCEQQPAALAWLSEQLGWPAAELPPWAGIALFEAPLTFGPAVEAQLHRHTATHDFQLVGGTAQLPARLRRPLAAEPATLAESELLEWGNYLASEPYVAHTHGVPENLPAYLAQKLRQLWRWLGAEDIPADPPYGGAPAPDTRLRDQQEQARLHQLRQELRAELAQQRHEAAQREATRTQELAQLRQQLAHSGQPAAERRQEQQEKARLEESLRAARAELAARNHELDARIQQLGHLIRQLQKPTASPAVAPPGLAARPLASVVPGKPSYRRLYQAERWGLVGLTMAIAVAGGWGVVRLLHPSKNHPLNSVPRRTTDYLVGESQSPPPVIIYDTLASAHATDSDTATTDSPEPRTTEPAATPPVASPAASLLVDSATPVSAPSRPRVPADSIEAGPSPTP